jgi:hypothetical protein
MAALQELLSAIFNEARAATEIKVKSHRPQIHSNSG